MTATVTSCAARTRTSSQRPVVFSSVPESPALTAPRAEGRDHLARRTAQLPVTSRFLYRIDHHSSRPSASLVVVSLLLCLLIVGVVLGFPSGWVIGSEVGMSATTLVMVFAIQHTQGVSRPPVNGSSMSCCGRFPEHRSAT
jgi:hypothetical protein